MSRPIQKSRYKLDTLLRRKHRPQRRQDIEKVPKKERVPLIQLADKVKKWTDYQLANGDQLSDEELREAATEIGCAPYEVLKHIRQYRAYHTAYPGQLPANAFTPLLRARNKDQQSKEKEQDNSISSDIAPRSKTLPRRHPPILSIDEPERSRIIAFSARIEELSRIKNNYSILPDGELSRVAEEFGCSEDWISKSIAHLREYQAAYPEEPSANAFTPLPRGRPKGRVVQEEIRHDIEAAQINKTWRTLNRDKTTSEISQPISGKLIHSLVSELHDNPHSLSTTYRVLQDNKRTNPGRVGVARDGIEILQEHMPWKDNKVSGPGTRIQLDIRPLPTVVNLQGIRCTVRFVGIRDDFSRYRPIWRLLPSKRVDEDGEVFGQDFTCQQIRELLALYCLKTESRPRIIYPDNGSQWSKKALGPYLQFLVAPGEDQTVLVSRRPYRPRGGGGIERDQQLIDEFIKYRPAFIVEQDYRKSLKEMKKRDIPRFEDLVADFEEFHDKWNTDRVDDQSSFFEKWSQGINKSLSMPSLGNLAVFAMSSQRKSVKADPAGLRIGQKDKRFVPFSDAPELFEQMTNASLAKQDVPVLIFPIGDEQIVFFSLDSEEITWELAIEKGKKQLTAKKHTDMIIALEQSITRGNATLSDLFTKKLLESANGPLVIDAFGRRPKIVVHQSADQQSNRQDSSTSSIAVSGDANTAIPTAMKEDNLTALAKTTRVADLSLNPERGRRANRAASTPPRVGSEKSKDKASSAAITPQIASESGAKLATSSSASATDLISDEEMNELAVWEAQLAARLHKKKDS